MDPIHPPFCWECRPCLDLLCPQIVSCPALVKQTAERLRADRQTLRTAWKILFHGTACASHAVALRLGKGKKKEKKGLINVGRLKPGKNFVLCFLGMHGSHCGLGAGTRHSGILCLPLVGWAPAGEWIHSGAQTEGGSKGGVGSRPLYGITGTPHGKTHPELRGISTFPGSQRNGSGAEAGTERGKVLINHLLMRLAWREV